MKYLCLIYLNEKEMDALPAADMNSLNARHLDFNNSLRKSGNWIEAEADSKTYRRRRSSRRVAR